MKTLAELLSRRFPAPILIIAVHEPSDTAHVAPATFDIRRTVPVALSQVRAQSGIAEVLPGQWFEAVVCGYAVTAPQVAPDGWDLAPDLPDGWMATEAAAASSPEDGSQ